MAATSGCVDEAPNNCLPGDNFNCVDDVDAGNGGDDDDTGTTPEICDDNIDNDGDGNVDCEDSDCDDAANCIDNDGDGYSSDVDCDDNEPDVHPDAQEVCDTVDNNCDGVVDEDAVDAVTYFADNDGDGYGDDDNGTSTVCVAPDGFVESNDDCDDDNVNVNPGAPEICDNLIDDNCDGAIDCDDALCAGQVGGSVTVDIGTPATDDTPLATAYWQDNATTSEAIGLSVSSLPGLTCELVCGVDTWCKMWIYTDSINVTASPYVSVFSDGYSFEQGMDTSVGAWIDHTSYSATPSQGVWFNLHICIEEPCSPE